MKKDVTAARARELVGEALTIRERLTLMGEEVYEYAAGGTDAHYAFNRAAHELAVAAENLVRLANHLSNTDP